MARAPKPPEPSPGPLPPRASAELFGHHAAEAALAGALAAGRLHHAWLLTGPEGIGKATLAYRFARRLLAGPAPDGSLALDPQHPVFRRVAAGAHADLLAVERGYDARRQRKQTVIPVEETRRVGQFMALTPAEGGWRVAIIDGADEMNPAAANALLKVLEEPPPRAVLLLISAAPGRLLPTLRSRCRRLRLAPLDEADMARALDCILPGLAEAERARLIALAEGAPGRAIALAGGEGLAIAEMVDQALAGPVPALAYSLADRLGRIEDGLAIFLELLRAALAAAVRDAGLGRAEPGAAPWLAAAPLAAWGDVWQALATLQAETLGFNLDPRQAMLAALDLLAHPGRTAA